MALDGQLAMKDIMGYDVYKSHPRVVGIADFHIGNYRYPIRDVIVEILLDWLAPRINDIEPDVVLFAGDAFRTRTPSAQDYADFGKFLNAIEAPIVMIPGNHDVISSRESTTLAPFAYYDGVYLASFPQVIHDPKYELVCIPWLPSKALSSSGLEGETTAGTIRTLLSMLKEQLKPSKFKILLAHCTALGTEYHDGANTVLGNDMLWTSDMFEGFDICVLGHIHKPQQVKGTDNAWYVGSPCPVSFNETGEKTLFVWDGAPAIIDLLTTPQFCQFTADELPNFIEGDYRHVFARITKEHGEPDPEEIPNFWWYEIVTRPPEHDVRQRLGADEAAGMSPMDALKAWLSLEGYEDDDVIALALELMEGEGA